MSLVVFNLAGLELVLEPFSWTAPLIVEVNWLVSLIRKAEIKETKRQRKDNKLLKQLEKQNPTRGRAHTVSLPASILDSA